MGGSCGAILGDEPERIMHATGQGIAHAFIRNPGTFIVGSFKSVESEESSLAGMLGHLHGQRPRCYATGKESGQADCSRLSKAQATRSYPYGGLPPRGITEVAAPGSFL